MGSGGSKNGSRNATAKYTKPTEDQTSQSSLTGFNGVTNEIYAGGNNDNVDDMHQVKTDITGTQLREMLSAHMKPFPQDSIIVSRTLRQDDNV